MFLGNPQELWDRPFRQHMSADARYLLLAMVINGASSGLSSLKGSYTRLARVFDAPIAPAELENKFKAAFREVEGSALGMIGKIVHFTNPGLRDYLQGVVKVDNLLPLIIPVVDSSSEFRECLSLCRNIKRTGSSGGDLGVWLKAFDRVVSRSAFGTHERLEVAIDLFDTFRHDMFLPGILAAVDNFVEYGLEFTDVTAACSLLERTTATLLPTHVEDHVRQAVSDRTAAMIHDCADALNLEDLQSLDSALFEYGIDSEVAAEAIHAGLAAFAKSVGNEVSDIDTFEGLDEFVETLTSFMRKRSYPDHSVRQSIERRREYLLEWGSHDPDSEYTGGGGDSHSAMRTSDDQIRSMFAGLQ